MFILFLFQTCKFYDFFSHDKYTYLISIFISIIFISGKHSTRSIYLYSAAELLLPNKVEQKFRCTLPGRARKYIFIFADTWVIHSKLITQKSSKISYIELSTNKLLPLEQFCIEGVKISGFIEMCCRAMEIESTISYSLLRSHKC